MLCIIINSRIEKNPQLLSLSFSRFLKSVCISISSRIQKLLQRNRCSSRFSPRWPRDGTITLTQFSFGKMVPRDSDFFLSWKKRFANLMGLRLGFSVLRLFPSEKIPNSIQNLVRGAYLGRSRLA